MKIYTVGGAVRDQLLGLPVKDRDYVVVGATPEQMLAEGFRPVGKDFPVFLHPKTQAEYALARTERKSGRGYKGFTVYAAPDVTLEDDLARRDLTINAMAEDENGELIDPYGGQEDLARRTLRHVGAAFVEDPVRILRLARFAARFDFQVAPETMALCREMVAMGEVDHLVPERVWAELAKGLMEAQPSRMFTVLRDCGALARLMPELDVLWGVPQPPKHHPEVDTGDHVMRVLDYAASQDWSLDTRFAALCHDLGKGVTPPEEWPRHIEHERRGVALVEALCERIKAPNDCRELAVLVCREHCNIHRAREMRSTTVLELLIRCDALRKPDRFKRLLDACIADARGRAGLETQVYPQAEYLLACRDAAFAVDAGAIAAATEDKAQIPEAVRLARLAALRALSHSD
ncbi:multifunctional CCA addition/repair protein [Chitinimonas sp. BJB300]|uniref:multifunctional CCA addition/repair protein n=1 Tax=Chitinimonas sp. BJB300 TaxID=1559339 RepID=UPI000C0F2B87|nr:multifunctional CCA addition/repair protein [Chitinimonas sp. BJB300]PHV10960.1 multifunctional CCA addition/repair protein [Chitinimonas sp. BJB300]TSJ89895.1 multifunctional CCA addition/repair protein [Chitinimonas sp. BJB300]